MRCLIHDVVFVLWYPTKQKHRYADARFQLTGYRTCQNPWRWSAGRPTSVCELSLHCVCYHMSATEITGPLCLACSQYTLTSFLNTWKRPQKTHSGFSVSCALKYRTLHVTRVCKASETIFVRNPMLIAIQWIKTSFFKFGEQKSNIRWIQNAFY
jgi:hypothetical protein